MAQVVVVDENPAACRVIQHLLGPDHHVDYWNTPLSESGCRAPDVVILKLDQTNHDGMELLSEVRECASEAPVVALVDTIELRRVVDAVHRGASDVVSQPIKVRDLQLAITRALARREASRTARDPGRVREIVGTSRAVTRLRAEIERVAASTAPVLITGESGVGKELVATAVHRLSGVSRGPLEVRNCGAVPEALVEAELFGTERGAYTDAIRRSGALELATGGTLFLDEIGELSVAAQAKLLRAIESGTYRRVGGTSVLRSDARCVAATNRDLRSSIRAREFREDLYYRINVCRIRIPPLRERVEDIPLLVEHFRSKLAGTPHAPSFSFGAYERLSAYSWPGNVRELRNVVWRALVGVPGDLVRAEDLCFE